MTTIVALEEFDRVVFAADTRVSGYHLNDGWVDKIVRNGWFTFAAAGLLRSIQVLQYAKLPVPPVVRDTDTVDRFVTKELVPAIKEAFEEADAGDAKDESVILAAVSNRVYMFYGDGSWTRSPSGRYAVGSGADYALGALEAGVSPEEAIRIASLYDSGTNSDARVVEITNR